MNDLSIQSPGNLDLTSQVQSSDEPDDPTVQHNILPTVKSKIIYHNPDSKSRNEAIVLGRAGKSNGKNKTWFNLKDLTINKHLSVDFSQIKGSKNTEKEFLIEDSHDNIEILKTKETELKNWITHNFYEEVEDSGQKVISIHWVITQKFKNNEIIYKACLVVRGFEENLKDISKDSPTCCKDNFCLVTSIIASNQWKTN